MMIFNFVLYFKYFSFILCICIFIDAMYVGVSPAGMNVLCVHVVSTGTGKFKIPWGWRTGGC